MVAYLLTLSVVVRSEAWSQSNDLGIYNYNASAVHSRPERFSK
jgi:hypothetical protein